MNSLQLLACQHNVMQYSKVLHIGQAAGLVTLNKLSGRWLVTLTQSCSEQFIFRGLTGCTHDYLLACCFAPQLQAVYTHSMGLQRCSIWELSCFGTAEVGIAIW